VVPLKPLVLVIEKFWGDKPRNILKLDPEQALGLVCQAARELGPYGVGLADKLDRMPQMSLDKEEAIEILCRETNLALEAGSFGYEKVRTLPESMDDCI